MEFTYEEVQFIISGLGVKLQELVEDADFYCRKYESACYDGTEEQKNFYERKSSETFDKRDKCEALMSKFLDLRENLKK